MRKLEFVAVFAALAMATPAVAQGRGRGNGGVPPGQRPAAGMCRIWIDGLPPGHQPAPTDCRTAAARVPYNGRIIYGDQPSESGRRVYDRNSQIYTNGQGCIRRTDQNGRIHTLCPDDNSRDGGVLPGTYGDRNRVYGDESGVRSDRDDVAKGKEKHAKHGKHKGDRDRDEDRDRNGDRW